MVSHENHGRRSYRQGLHLKDEHAHRYEIAFADPRRTNGLLWMVEQGILEQVLNRLHPRPQTAVDFACGTGRVLNWLADRIPSTTGVDVSAAMLERAAHSAPAAHLVLGDVTREPNLVTGPFDLVTMFRFLLNAEPELRAAALAWASRNVSEGGALIVNVHRNANSATGLIVRARRRFQRSHAPWMLSIGAATALLEQHGFSVLARYGYGYLPYGVRGSRKLPFPRLILALESRLAGERFFAHLASHVILLARRTEPSETLSGLPKTMSTRKVE